GIPGATSQPSADGAQSCAGGFAAALSCAVRVRADARIAGCRRGRSGILPALSAVQPARGAAACSTLCLRAAAMLTLLIVSQILSWIVILGLGLALLALARQVGVLHMRVAPAGALMTGKGPTVGEAAPVMEAVTLDGRRWRSASRGPASSFCCSSPRIAPCARTLSLSPRISPAPKSWRLFLSATI